MAWIQAFQTLSSDAGWRAASLTAEMPSSTTGKTNPPRLLSIRHFSTVSPTKSDAWNGVGAAVWSGQTAWWNPTSRGTAGCRCQVGVQGRGGQGGCWRVGLASSHCCVSVLFSLCWSQATLNWGPDSLLLTPASGMGSGHSEDPSQIWELYFTNKGHPDRPSLLGISVFLSLTEP